jgi:hypothetical protein
MSTVTGGLIVGMEILQHADAIGRGLDRSACRLSGQPLASLRAAGLHGRHAAQSSAQRRQAVR